MIEDLEKLKRLEKLVLLSIKTMQLHNYDTTEIKEAINLHSEITVLRIKKDK